MDPFTLAFTLRKDLSEGFRLSNPKHCPEHVCEVMQSCWNAIPEKRPSFSSIKTHYEIFYHLNDCKSDANPLTHGDYVEDVKKDQSETQMKFVEFLVHKQNLEKQFNEINRYLYKMRNLHSYCDFILLTSIYLQNAKTIFVG